MLRGYGQPKMSILVELYTLIDISFFSCFFFYMQSMVLGFNC